MGAEWPVLITARGLRAFVDGYVAVLLPAYLLALGFGTLDVGLISTATLLGSALLTVGVGAWGHRSHPRWLLQGAALLMCVTGLGFAGFSSLAPLLLIAFLGTLNPSSGDVSVFLPLEHARLAESPPAERVTVFARYSLTAAVCSAIGALAVAIPDLLASRDVDRLIAFRLMFVFYACVGLAVWALYRRLPRPSSQSIATGATALGPSRRTVVHLASLFAVDAFAGGLVVQSLLALWLFEKFELSLAAAGTFFFWAGLLSAASQLAAPWVASRIGLLNTMVFTHIPSSIALIAAAIAPQLELALGLLLLRSALSQMDVPTRSAFVMSMVSPPERAAAASFTAVPRSLASAISPALGGAMFAAGWLAAPLVVCGALKIAYDVAILGSFRRERARS